MVRSDRPTAERTFSLVHRHGHDVFVVVFGDGRAVRLEIFDSGRVRASVVFDILEPDGMVIPSNIASALSRKAVHIMPGDDPRFFAGKLRKLCRFGGKVIPAEVKAVFDVVPALFSKKTEKKIHMVKLTMAALLVDGVDVVALAHEVLVEGIMDE